MKKSVKDINFAYRIMLFSDVQSVRFMLAMGELIWGIGLLHPGDTMESEPYHSMRDIMPETAWAVMWIVLGLIQLYILYARKQALKSAIWFAGVSSAIWWFTTLSMYLCTTLCHLPVPAGLAGTFVLSMASTWVWMRSGWMVKGERRKDYL
jgi:hypothetical protein